MSRFDITSRHFKAYYHLIKSKPGRRPRRTYNFIGFVPWLFWLVAGLLWVYSLFWINPDNMTGLGLISVFPLSLFLAYLVLVLGFAAIFLQSKPKEMVFVAYCLLLILMLHATPQITYKTLRYSWAWKHVGIVDYIQRFGTVDPQIGVQGIYHNWPGFFALNALLTKIAGFPSALSYAGWSPFIFEILFASAVFFLLNIITDNRRVAWLAVWLFLITNWIGQDYFSPQSLGFFLYLICIGLVLWGYGSNSGGIFKPILRSRLFNPIRPFLKKFEKFNIPKIQNGVGLSKTAKLLILILVLLTILIIVASHQLTPYILFAALFLLLIFGYHRWIALPFWIAAFEELWFILPARPYLGNVVLSIVESFGELSGNLESGFIDVGSISPSQVIVAWSGRILCGMIGLLAVYGFIVRIKKGYIELTALLLAIAPMPMLFLSAYGGEAIFRVYLFSLPFLAFMAAWGLLALERETKKWLVPTVTGGISVVFLLLFMMAYYGKEKQYYFTADEVRASQYLAEIAPPNSLLVEGSRNYPSQFKNYEYFTYVPIDREPLKSRERLLADPVNVLSEWLSDPQYSESYLIITRSHKEFVSAIGVMGPDDLDHIQNELLQSDRFEVVYSNKDAVIFKAR